jgi:hypothetical protein
VRSRLIVAVVCAWLTVACHTEPVVSNTGYAGTWTRGSDRARSTVSIWPDGDGYRFRVGMTTDNDSRTIECDWNGNCAEVVDGQRTRDYRFTPRVDAETGHLIVECEVRATEDGSLSEHFVDEVVVAPDGLAIDVFTIEQDGVTYERGAGGKRTFRKISNEVASPPENRSR